MSHGLPDPPIEPALQQDVDGLAPKFRDAIVGLLSDLEAVGLAGIIAESVRSPERQAWLFGFGREYDDGRGVVTQAATGAHSWHTYGLAVDIISKAHGWDAPAHFWATLGALARSRGLAWGGDWPRFQDRPHVQFGAPMRQSPSHRAAELMAADGLPAVWSEVHAA